MDSFQIAFFSDKGVQMSNLIRNMILTIDEAEHVCELDDDKTQQSLDEIKVKIISLQESIIGYIRNVENMQMDVYRNLNQGNENE